MEKLMLKFDNVSKQYRLGQIGGTTLRDELQRMGARLHGRNDPTKKVNDRSYKRGETFLALDGISFAVRKGERVGIIGHNGAGKSTLLKLVSRITAPTSGKIGLNGRVTSMLEVGTGFHGELTGRENIYMNGAILGMTKKEIDVKMEKIIEFSECSQFIDTPVKRYSSGMYVKLAFSVAVHLDCEIMIMDEVLAVGDIAFQKKCLDKMNEVSKAEGRTILYVSHNMTTIRELCDRVVVLDHGKVVFDGDVETGIDVYMDTSFHNKLSIDYDGIPRYEWLEDTKIRMMYTAFRNGRNVFDHSEKMEILMRWINEKDVKNLCLRIEIWTVESKPIGTAFLYDFYDGNIHDQEEVCILVDLRSIAPGRYTMRYSFFQRGTQGSNSNVEYVEGLAFEVLPYSDIAWNGKWWGHIKLPDLQLSCAGKHLQ